MIGNLRSEMERSGVAVKDVAEYLGVRCATVSDKLRGRFQFRVDEANMIKKHFFPDCSLDYLFGQDSDDPETAVER